MMPPRPENDLKQYWVMRNAKSLDGLPGVATAHNSMKPFLPTEIVYKKDNESVPTSWNILDGFDLKLVAAFGLGVLVTTTCSKILKGIAEGMLL
jgi:hypothetical protein